MINACCQAINLSLFHVLLAQANLHWRVHPAQLVAIQSNLSWRLVPTDVTDTEELAPPDGYTLYGFPLTVDAKYSKSKIELYHGDELIAAIENLAIPTGFQD